MGPRSHPDGIATEATGAVWAAEASAGRLVQFCPDGTPDGPVEVPARMVTSPCFDGADLIAVMGDNRAEPDRRGSIFEHRST